MIAEDSELPLTVWLTGVEPYFEEFSLDADAAMKALGIKRSRLTQISGRELRVGKVRIERYTRAMYRAADVEAYRNWTRRTAAHQRSAEVVHDAASRLDAVKTDMMTHLLDALACQGDHLRSSQESTASTLRRQILVSADDVARRLEALRSIAVAVKNQGLNAQAAASARQTTVEERFNELSAAVSLVQELVVGQVAQGERASEEHRQTLERLAAQVEAQSLTQRELGARLGEIKSEVHALAGCIEHLTREIAGLTQALTKVEPAPAPPRRQRARLRKAISSPAVFP